MNKRGALITVFTLVILFAGVNWLRTESTVFNLFFPPSGIYDPLASAPLSSSEKRYEFEVIHKYPGRYEIAINAPSSPGVGVLYEMGFQAKVVISTESKVLMEKSISRPSSQFWGDKTGGVVLLGYRIPEMVDVEQSVTIIVATSGDVASFNNDYGASNVVVKKRSDK
jgi:hypothetical protein